MDRTKVTIEFETEAKAEAFRRFLDTDAELIRWNLAARDGSYALVWLAEGDEDRS